MKKEQKELIEVLNGEELAYKDVIVLVEGENLILNGKVYGKITKKNYRAISDAWKMQEYGTTDLKEIMTIEGF